MSTKTFGERLYKLRFDFELNQGQLAEKIGITRQSLSLYELAERTPNIEVLEKISEYFGVSTDYLLGLSDSKYRDDLGSSKELKRLEEENEMLKRKLEAITAIINNK